MPRKRAATLLNAFLVVVVSYCGVAARAHAHSSQIAFLSGERNDSQPPASETPIPPPAAQEENTNFDGKWIFSSGGCKRTGSVLATIRKGKIFVRGGGGFVEPDGTLHSFGAGGGTSLTAVGQLSGNTGSGTFNRSDGCVGSWIGIKQ